MKRALNKSSSPTPTYTRDVITLHQAAPECRLPEHVTSIGTVI